MKSQKIWLLLVAIAVVFAFNFVISCSDDSGKTGEQEKPGEGDVGPITNDPSKWNVLFDSRGGSVVLTQHVTKNQSAVKPDNPTRAGFTFDGWYETYYCSDPIFEEKLIVDGQILASIKEIEWDFDNPITDNTVLYARWIGGEKWLQAEGSWRGWKYWFMFGQVIYLEKGIYDAGMVFFGNTNNPNLQDIWFGVFRYAEDGILFPDWVGGNQTVADPESPTGFRLVNTNRKYVTKPDNSWDDIEGLTYQLFPGNDDYGPVKFASGGQALFGFHRGSTTFEVDEAAWYFVIYENGLGTQDNGVGGSTELYEMFIYKKGNPNNLLKNGDFWYTDEDAFADSKIERFNSNDFFKFDPPLVESGINPEIPGLAPGMWYITVSNQNRWAVPYMPEYAYDGWCFYTDGFIKTGSDLLWPEPDFSHWF